MNPTLNPTEGSASHASYRQLITVFIIALLLFCLLRWQPEPWIAAQIEQQAQQHGLRVHYEEIKMKGLSIHLKQFSIQSTQMNKPIKLDTISLAPAWSSLFNLETGIYIETVWQQQHANAVILQKPSSITIQSLHAQVDAATLQPLITDQLPIPLNIQGQIQISADIELDTIQGRPLTGHLLLSWNDATITMPSLQLPALGNYKLDLQSTDANSPWQWNLQGGQALSLHGNGSINTSSASLQSWQLDGKIEVHANQKIPMLSSMLGSTSKQFRLTGSIVHPHIQAL